jgi:hypothetical protein
LRFCFFVALAASRHISSDEFQAVFDSVPAPQYNKILMPPSAEYRRPPILRLQWFYWREEARTERPWSDDSGLFIGEKPDFSGDFRRPNLTMWNILGIIIFHRH